MKIRVLRVEVGLGFFLCVEVVEVPVEFVEPMYGRQELIAVAQVVLAELPGVVAERFEKFGDRRILGLDSLLVAWHADGQHSSAVGVLARSERRAPGRTALLGVVVGGRSRLRRRSRSIWVRPEGDVAGVLFSGGSRHGAPV